MVIDEMDIDFESMSDEDLEAMSSHVKRAVEAKQERQHAKLLDEAASLAAQAGKAVRFSALRSRLPAKYQSNTNPSETWSGRGKKPLWLIAKLDEGLTLEELGIG